MSRTRRGLLALLIVGLGLGLALQMSPSRAGSTAACTSIPVPSTAAAGSAGRMDLWISRAARSSAATRSRTSSDHAFALSSDRTRARTSRTSKGFVR